MKRIAASNQGSMKSIPLNNLFSCCNHDVSTISYEAVTHTQELIILTLRLFSYHFKSPALLGCVTLLLKKLQIMTILTCLHAFQSHNRVERFRTCICVSFRSPTCIRHWEQLLQHQFRGPVSPRETAVQTASCILCIHRLSSLQEEYQKFKKLSRQLI